MPKTGYNVLLISSDHHRGDALGILGHPLAFTPHLDKLAQQGILFRRVYSECPVCIPARMTIMTGRRPGTDEGSTGYNYYEECSPILQKQTLPGLFGRSGYQTQGIGKMHFFPQRCRYGFDATTIEEEGRVLPGLHRDDYEQWLQDRGLAAQYHSHGVTNNELTARPWHLSEDAHPTSWTARETCRWLLRRDPQVPFFLWMSFSAPHPPFTPPQALWELYRGAPVPEPRKGDWSSPDMLPAEIRRISLPGNHETYTGLRYAQTVRAYYALITQIDLQISLVLGTLREKGLLDDTIILYFADHGDMMGDFGLFAKRVFYEGASNVPCILVLPEGHPEYRCGEICRNPLGLQDLLPTLLDAAGLEIPGGITGISALEGLRDPGKSRRLIHGDYRKGKETPDSSHLLTDGRIKYIWYNEGDIEQLFDLHNDPEERVNLAAQEEHRDLTRKWRKTLASVLEQEKSPDVQDGKLVSRPYPRIEEKQYRARSTFNPRGMHY
ncbi:MAG: sulfatase-like hydrolase/transferase [Spirochaetales bacterium]|nr:sulfatase-like hydrolase/transferase [Spirochaetales bacterium]